MAAANCPYGGNGQWCIANARPRQGQCGICLQWAMRVNSRGTCGPCMDRELGVGPMGSCPCAAARKIVNDERVARAGLQAGLAAGGGGAPAGPATQQAATAQGAPGPQGHPPPAPAAPPAPGPGMLALPAPPGPPPPQQGPPAPQSGAKAAPPALPAGVGAPPTPGGGAGSSAAQPGAAPPQGSQPGSSNAPAGAGLGRWAARDLQEARDDLRRVKDMLHALAASMEETADRLVVQHEWMQEVTAQVTAVTAGQQELQWRLDNLQGQHEGSMGLLQQVIAGLGRLHAGSTTSGSAGSSTADATAWFMTGPAEERDEHVPEPSDGTGGAEPAPEGPGEGE